MNVDFWVQSRTCQICLTKIFTRFFFFFLSSLVSDSHERKTPGIAERPEPAFIMCPLRRLLYRPYYYCRVPSFM